LCVNSADDGIKGRDYLIITGGTIDVTSGADGLVSTNSEDSGIGYVNICGGDITICSGTDGIQAATELIIDAGNINVLSGGGSSSVEFKEESFDRPGGFGFFGTATDNSSDDSLESQKALKGISAVKINGGTFLLDCADDAVHSNGSVSISDGALTISAGDDGVHADEQLFVSGGTIDITKCYEGLEGKQIELSGGSINIVSFDDGINATSGSGSMFGGEAADGVYISISGGEIIVNASGDGLDSNGTVAMSGGYVTVYGPTSNNNGALDYESSFAVSGGTLIALGSSGMAQVPSTLSQPCLSVSAQVAAGAVLEVRDESGAVVLSTTTPKACGSLIFSSDKFIAEKDYSVFSDGVLLETITAKEGVAGSGGSGFGGFGGGGRGDRPAGNKPQQPGQGELPNGEKPTPPDDVTDFGGRGDRVQFDVPSDIV
ncbi:MAG: carbohydrate-binding domain-containing protein, partial [Oscillospiraceae bacterium]